MISASGTSLHVDLDRSQNATGGVDVEQTEPIVPKISEDLKVEGKGSIRLRQSPS